MRLRIMLALSCGLFAAAAGIWIARSTNESGAAVASDLRAFLPSLASDSSTLANPSPTPTPTPIGGGSGGGGGGPLEIYVSLDIVGVEPNADPDGMVDIPIFAAASAHLPGPLDAPVTVIGTVTIDPHPVDAAGCTWARTYASTEFTMTVLPPVAGSNGISLFFEAPEWHYDISRPGVGFVTRLPTFGEQKMLAFVGYAFPEYGPLAPSPLDVPPVSVMPACIKRELNLQRSVQLADVTLRVVIYQPPCLLPLP